MSEDLVYRLRKRAEIRRQISTRKSVQKGARDLISDLLEEAADTIESLAGVTKPQTPAATTDIPEQPPAPKLVLSKTVLKTLALQGQPAPKCQTCGGKGEIPNRDWGVMQPCPTCSKPEGK